MARPRSVPTKIISASVTETEHHAVDAFARANGLTLSAAIGQLIRIGYRESIGERRALEPVISPNEYDGVDLQVSFRREDYALCQRVLTLLAEHAAPAREEMH